MSTKNWLDTVPICDPYAYQADVICEDCASQIIEALESKGVEDTGDANDFPQGMSSSEETDSPAHCGMHAKCVNAVQIPGGNKVGCPLSCSLTREGVEYTRNSIAEHILFGTAHQKGVSQLWRHLYSDLIKDGPLIQLTDKILPPAIRREVVVLTRNGGKVSPQTFTDLDYVYGTASDPLALTLWRLEIYADDAGYGRLDTAQLPPSESSENNSASLLEDAIRELAWD
jgi:hypothetical protein